MTERQIVVCIDGPAASGKTTVAKALAETLGFLYLDTGVLYRALTWVGLKKGISPSDGPQLAALARSLNIDVKPAPPDDARQTIVLADNEDVSLSIRTPVVDRNVSEVAAHPEVREALKAVQREFARRGGVVLAGRDMGTVIWPQAEVKLFLDATVEERARRRQKQAAQQGTKLDLDSVLADLKRRDQYDSGRAVAPLRAADDAVIVDSTPMTENEVVAMVLDIVRSIQSAGAGDSTAS